MDNKVYIVKEIHRHFYNDEDYEHLEKNILGIFDTESAAKIFINEYLKQFDQFNKYFEINNDSDCISIKFLLDDYGESERRIRIRPYSRNKGYVQCKELSEKEYIDNHKWYEEYKRRNES